jgi:hypothetical protein
VILCLSGDKRIIGTNLEIRASGGVAGKPSFGGQAGRQDNDQILMEIENEKLTM